LDANPKNPDAVRLLGFFVPFFKVQFKRYHFPKMTFGEDLNYMPEQYWVEKAIMI